MLRLLREDCPEGDLLAGWKLSGARVQCQCVPSTAAVGVRSSCDATRTSRTFVANARRHGAPPVVVTAGRTDGELELVVEDAGPGVPDDVRARLFDESVRSAESATTPGSGLGLAIARSYAHAHGGELLLDRQGDSGARFRFVLPAPSLEP